MVYEDADYARAALDAGGLGDVVKARLASDLMPAIGAALQGRHFVSVLCTSMKETNFFGFQERPKQQNVKQ